MQADHPPSQSPRIAKPTGEKTCFLPRAVGREFRIDSFGNKRREDGEVRNSQAHLLLHFSLVPFSIFLPNEFYGGPAHSFDAFGCSF